MTRLSASSYRNGSPLPEWSADRRTVLFDRPGAKGEPAIRIAVDAATGAEREVGAAGARLSLDGAKTYTTTSIAGGQVIVERDVRSGTAREVLRRYPERGTWELTPDGTAIVATSTDPATKQSLVLHCTLADGSVRTLLRMPFVANARLAIVGQRDNSVGVQWNERFWWAPLDGRPSKHLTELDGLRSFSLHPDGRQLALDDRAEPRSGGQVHVLENFLPVTKR